MRTLLAKFEACACRRSVLAGFASLGLLLAGITPAAASKCAGVTLPNSVSVDGTRLYLNGIGLRTYSVLAVDIYVAGLYLQKPTHNPQAILSSRGTKLLLLHFVHDVSAGSVRNAWRTALIKNCIAPCSLSPILLSRFLAALRPVTAGENVTLIFGKEGLLAYYGSTLAGHISDAQFSDAMLASFIGSHPASVVLKHDLLGR